MNSGSLTDVIVARTQKQTRAHTPTDKHNAFIWRNSASIRAGTPGADRVQQEAALVGHTAGGEPLVMGRLWRCRHVFQAAGAGMARRAGYYLVSRKQQMPNGEWNESRTSACV